jgi:hypothetical protein
MEFSRKSKRSTNLGALQHLYQTVYVWTIHMYAHELLPGTEQRLVSCLGRLGHNIIEDGIPHPSGARDDDRTKSRVRVWDVPQERLVEGVIKTRQALFVGRRRASALARYRDLDALEHDGHVLREKTKRRRA